MIYDADIRVARDGSVRVSERVVVDPDWKATYGDSLQAAERLINGYAKEAKQRGGKDVKTFDSDSARAEFRYPSLAAFVRAWPDSSDNGKRWDRSLYRRLTGSSGPEEELILFRMSPPDRSKEVKNQRYPVLRFYVTPPAPALRHNAHKVVGGTYFWRFTENMSAADSVWIVWPATPAP